MASTIGNYFDMLALIRKQPRTADDIVEVTGVRRTTAKRFLDALCAEGHGYISGHRPAARTGKPAPVYSYQTTMFEKQNVVYTPKR